ncbi:hypothetical protein HN51_019520 [Arachis hypogaea]|uniref:Uncharacterized protein n=1 Tax=Arachis hypogaea TaxID=3818 RepID=A0A445BX73_ARAHY|nr:uncharacterized protein LOC112705274 [Arachis hypogaea]QHO31299.1 uncharacterized protein DS421_8g240390 [Arachis hypogaea]RYR43330.1 hypothetical protein Ahy_A08g039751 [Arachis hypogaea]
MGCCFSTIDTPNTNKDQNSLKSDLIHENLNHRAPPSPPPVEEKSVVKEVLSETPISKPQVSVLTIETETQLPKIQNSKCPIFNEAQEQVSLEVSQITETCSISESFFSTTTNATTAATGAETREDEATSKLRTIEGTQNLNRSQSKHSCDAKSIGGRERRPKSPSRTLPEKRVPASPQSACQRDSGQVRRRPGESTGRRARSPSSVGRFCDGNRRNQVKPRGNGGRRLAPAKGVVKENCRKENDVVTHEESLDNPRVSLECFIFL